MKAERTHVQKVIPAVLALEALALLVAVGAWFVTRSVIAAVGVYAAGALVSALFFVQAKLNDKAQGRSGGIVE